MERTVVQAISRDGHGAAVGFQEKVSTVAIWWLIGELQAEYAVGHDAKPRTAIQADLPPEGFKTRASGGR